MTSLVLMYVYYDKNGDIKAITPGLDESFSRICDVATFPLSEVEMFLSGQKSTFEYTITKISSLAGDKFKLQKKPSAISYTRTLDSYLTKIEPARQGKIIIVENDTIAKTINIYLSADFRELQRYGSEEEQESVDDFIRYGYSTIYITERNNPYNLRHTVTFSPRELFEKGSLHFSHENDYTNSSAYTKKIIAGYGYKERVKK
jgi:hypothetical protein